MKKALQVGIAALVLALLIGAPVLGYNMGRSDEFQSNQEANNETIAQINEYAQSVFADAYAEGLRQGRENSRNGDAPKWAVDYITAYCTQDSAYIAAHTKNSDGTTPTAEAVRKLFSGQVNQGTNCVNWQYLGVSEVTGQLNWVLYQANGKKGWFGMDQIGDGFVTGLAFELWE